MIIEIGLLLTVTSGGLLISNYTRNNTDVSKQMENTIKEIFENMGFGIPKGKGKNRWIEYPRLVGKPDVHKTYVSLTYKIPKGINLALLDKLKDSIMEALGTDNMELSTAGKSIIKMRIATQPMPDNVKLAPFVEAFKNKKWEVPLGVHQFGIETHNFDYYPTLVGGGVIRFGKSNFMKNLVTFLINQNPDDVEFYILDLKEGVEFSEFKSLKQVKKVASTVDEAADLLERLDKKLTDTSHWFREKNIKDITHTGLSKRIFVLVDESHELAPPDHLDKKEQKPYRKCQNLLQKIVSKGGFCGFRTIVFTQYPVNESIPRRIKQNSPARLTLRVADSTASRVILDEDGAQDLPPVKGRAIYKTFKKSVIQIPYSDDHFNEFLLPYVEKEEKQDVAEPIAEATGTDIIDD